MGPPLVLVVIGLSGELLTGLLAGTERWLRDQLVLSCGAQLLGPGHFFAFGMVAAVLHTQVLDDLLRLRRSWRVASLASPGHLRPLRRHHGVKAARRPALEHAA